MGSFECQQELYGILRILIHTCSAQSLFPSEVRLIPLHIAQEILLISEILFVWFVCLFVFSSHTSVFCALIGKHSRSFSSGHIFAPPFLAA